MYSLDLVGKPVSRRKAFFGFDFLETRLPAWNSLYLYRVRRKFQGQNFPIDKLALKLHDISKVDPLLALAVLQTIEMYHWHIIPRDLRLLPLAGGIVDYHEGEVVLIANRRGRSIYLAGPLWKLMDAANQTAAIIHEAIYALIKPRPDPSSKDPRVFLSQDSVKVREVTHLLFEKDLFDPGFVINPGELPFLDRSQLPGKYVCGNARYGRQRLFLALALSPRSRRSVENEVPCGRSPKNSDGPRCGLPSWPSQRLRPPKRSSVAAG